MGTWPNNAIKAQKHAYDSGFQKPVEARGRHLMVISIYNTPDHLRVLQSTSGGQHIVTARKPKTEFPN
jgi:hypothetical protein